MTPFFFGTSDHRLYGAYDPPAVALARPRAVVICYPWGHEYVHAHRALRQLARMLADKGLHVFRFDYFGTGDSGGEADGATLAMWEADALLAADELRAISGVPQVTLLGLRLGGVVAARAAAALGNGSEGLILWDAVFDGSAFLQDLFRLYREPYYRCRDSISRSGKPGGGVELLGYPLTDAIEREIRGTDLQTLAGRLPVPFHVLTTTSADDHARAIATLGREGAGVIGAHVPAMPCWLEEWPNNVGVVPAEALDRIVSWLS